MIQPASLTWLAGHELRLGWRDWVSLMTAGGRTRGRTAFVALIFVGIFMHVFAYWTVATYADAGLGSDTAALVGITGTLFLSWSLLLSQAMEFVTRAFYSRSDLDLILTSPASARKVFAVRMGRIATAAVAIAVLLAAPFINVLAALGGGRWLAAYGVVIAMGAVATAASLALTIALFRTIGAKRTRLIAQIVAAVIGAAFVIGLQVAAIFSAGNLSRYAALQSDWMLRHAPDTASAFWWPARAVLGDYIALAAVFGFAAAVLGLAIAVFSRRFGEHAVAAAGVSNAAVQQRRWVLAFRRRSPARTLRHKEWTLLKRDPWLVSQTLMQILYLLPPALLLWVTFRTGHDAFIVLIPVIVMAAGQLAGGLAWLVISGRTRRTSFRLRRCGQSNPARQDRSRHRHGGADFRADRCVPGIRCRVRSGGLRTGHFVGSGRSDDDPALLSRAGAPKSFPAQADVLADRDFCGSIFVDRLGRDLGARGSGFVAGDRPGHRRIRHPGRRLDA